MSSLFKTAIVEKRNVLNELRSNNMTVQELRFFSIYLSKINPWDKSTRVVKFTFSDFQKIMEFGKLNKAQLLASTDSLLSKLVHIPNENGGFSSFQLFKKCRIDKNENDEWFVEIDAHDDALPLMFDFKNRYFKYELWNALRLKSPNQVRMYEILKQYESLGKREITVLELRELLGIAITEYSDRTGWSNFKTRVLDSCQQALKENTDICFTYERGKTGKGGKWLTVVFYIYKNTEYKDPLTLEKFIEIKTAEDEKNEHTQLENQLTIDDVLEEIEDKEIDYGGDLANLLGSVACADEFTIEQVRVLQDLVIQAIPVSDDIKRCNYLLRQVHKMNTYKPKKDKRFTYLRSMIENDIKG